MKKIFTTLAVAAFSTVSALGVYAADAPCKNEMRSAWVATVWRLDWPSSVVTTTGNESQIQSQKNDMICLLDSLHINNLNTINFQVRSRCDAMYKSSYEPWSTDLVSKRGMDPGYDPLAFVIEECHKRGMECHAWINPYRYESIVGQWSGGAGDYRKEHPDWLLDVNGASILNPGKPEVTQRICDIIAEIVTNYDVDGVLFDDYFYLSGTQSSQDSDLYNAYVEAGGSLSQNDWRRDNVNRMVASVYATIKSIKPYVRFGVAPAGIACTSTSVARQYGISPCPTGSDWQYNDIFSDPIAWVSTQSLDFISPQIYWTIGYSTDYNAATRWWSEIAAKWDRHMYVSHSISSLTKTSKVPGATEFESSLLSDDGITTLASGPNNTSFEEFANEIRLNREYTQNNAPGSIFYSCKYLYKNAPLFAHYLKNSVFNTPALLPSMTWFPVSNPGSVTNVARSGDKLSWTPVDGMRYTVYAVPATVDQINFSREAEYLLGVSYTSSYTIPSEYLSGYDFAVCVYDRYGNEYSPVFVGASTSNLEAPKLISPAPGETIEQPFDFVWEPVDKATNYIIEISDAADFSKLMYVKAVESTACSSSEFYKLPIETTLYWRVHSCGNNFNDGISESRSFSSRNLELLSPMNGEEDVALCPTIEWTFGDRDVNVQISSSELFETSRIVYEGSSNNGKLTVPKSYLAYYKTYYLRLSYERNGEKCTTPTSVFTTLAGVTEVPRIVHPADGGKLFSNDHIVLSEVEGHSSLRVEVSETTAFPARSIYAQSSIDRLTFTDPKSADTITLGGKSLEDGKTYYARARAKYQSPEGEVDTDFSPVISFVYSKETNAVDDIVVDSSGENAPVELFGIDGRRVVNPTSGIYIERKGNKTSKVLVK